CTLWLHRVSRVNPVRSPDASFADRPRMHSRGLGIDRLPHFLVAIIGRAYCETHYLRSPLRDRGACQADPYRRSDRVGEILSASGTSQRRHHSPAHGGDTGPAWRIRDLLLPHLKNVAVSRREDFAGVLYLGGYDVEVPDIMRSDPRP